MRRWWILGPILLLLPLGAGRAAANAGPHGGYAPTTDACASCHRAHTAVAPNLLKAQVPDLCFTCHGSAAPGANTNVADGRWEGPGGGDLLGGGFFTYKGQATTSSHSIDGTPQYAWGSGTTWWSQWDCAGCHNPISGLVWPGAPQFGVGPNPNYPGQNVAMDLTCTSCHDVHGNPNYRLLQQRLHPDQPQQTDANGYVLITSTEPGGNDPDGPGYTPVYTSPNYDLGLGDWCRGCHYTYAQTVSVKEFDAWDGAGPVTRYRHPMDMNIVISGGLTTTLPLERNQQLFCLTCHYAHGTATQMTGFAANVPPTNDSALLRIDNRGVCEECHKK